MKRLIGRLRNTTPAWAKKTRNAMLTVAGASLSSAIFYTQLPEPVSALIPRSLVVAIGSVGLVASFLAQCMEE